MQLDKYAFGSNYTQKERTAAVVAHAHRVQAGRTGQVGQQQQQHDNIVTMSKIGTDQGRLTPIRIVDVRTTLSDTYTQTSGYIITLHENATVNWSELENEKVAN